ncbi:Phage-related protein, tail component [Pseudomonas sp. URIL14HWK12:I8]|uniref:TipJ family phage tail tip protein n=2 Tax=Pseudomonadota TaxID=1224 RepID=UPI00040D6B56|nr:Phage-related protein, tail component [Pseudomonas sp. URIL14HWK12:I8]
MGAAAHLDITGAKGGESKPKTPVEAPDSLQSTNIAKILLAVGEGEFDGTPTDRDIYLDNTPIMDASGNVNFPGVKWEWRRGSVEQGYIQGIPSIESENTVNVELRSDSPYTRSLSNTQLSAVRVRMSWPRLVSQDSSGNTNGYRIEYAIDIATDGGAYVEAHLGAVDGKTTNGYQRSVRVNLPKATTGWMMRVRRITPNANSGTVGDTMTIAGYTEIIDQKLSYPNTALLYIEFDAQQFQNIPAVTVDCKAKLWPVPTNYDPATRTYTGVWDGTFKQAWTNNPAFVTYGLCVEDRFGLGKRIKSWMVDKWEMYRIAQYCDQLVPDGIGGQEPRYLCDMNLQGRAEAWTLLRDLSAIYRGMVYWAHGSLFMQADMPRAQDIDYVFTRANVIDGEFVYGGAERNTHYSRALVSYDNPANNYDTDVIPVTDLALQRRYRDRPIEISAIGCTRASEAQRRGKWALLSNSQDRTVTFKTGMEGRIPLPGYVIPVADELVAGRPNGGRISSAAGRVVTLDRDTPIKAGDRLILNLPSGTAQARTVQSVAGRAVTVTTAYSVQPEPELQWAIDYDDLAVQLFRVLKTTRTQEGDYEITALEFNPSKFAAIDTGAKLDERPISVIPVTTVLPPTSVTLTSTYAVDQGIGVNTMTIAWPAVQGAVAYDVEWRKDNGNWVRVQRTGAASVEVVGIYAGAYLARVRAISSFDITSIWRNSSLTELQGKVGLPPAVASLSATPLVYGTRLDWAFPPGAEDTQRTEIWQSPTTSHDDAAKLGDYAYPQAEHEIHGLAAGVSFYYWARLVDRSGNVGPWYPAGVGVNGQSSSNQSEYEEYFKDKISNGALYPALREEISLISGPPTQAGSVAQRLAAEATARAQAIATEATARGQAIAAETSARNQAIATEVVDRNKAIAVETQARTKAISDESAARAQGLLSEAQARGAAITSETQARQSADDSLSQKIDTVTASAGNNAAAIQAEATTRANADSALGQSIATVAASTASNAAAIGNETTARTNADSALASQIATLRAESGGFDSTLNYGFASTTEGWSGTRCTLAVENGRLIVTNDGAGAYLNAPAVSIKGRDHDRIRCRITRRAGTGWTGQVSYATAGHGSSTAYNKIIPNPGLAVGQTMVLEWDMSQLTNGGSDWSDSTITRFYLWISGTAGDVFEIDWIAVGQIAPSASVASVVDERTARISGDEANASAVTALGSSLTTTNQNVTAAQQAAQDAATLAGGKGKVLVQATAPAAADRLPQNLWIDTTGSANTPKRWSGTAWLAVTDKVATDAAAAAQSALSQLAGKADASALQALSTTVTNQGNTLSSQGSSITELNNSLQTTNGNVATAQQAAQAAASLAGSKGKVLYQSAAPAVADRQAENLWIDTTGAANTPKRWNGSAWVAVTDKVATDAAAAAASALAQVANKADASALQALNSEVISQGTTLTSQGAALTQLKASIGQQPDNLILRSSFEDGLVEPWTNNPGITNISAHPSAGKGISFYDNSFCGVGFNVLTKGGEQFDLAADVWPNYMTAGQTTRLQMQFQDKAGASLGYFTAFTVSATTTGFKTQTGRITAPEGAVSARFVTRTEPADGTGRSLWCNILARRVTAADAANADALTNLTTTVTQQGTTLTSHGQALTQLNNDLQTVAQGKADASALQTLSNTVTSQGNTLSSQGASITQLNSGLQTTNGNVTTAQQAAQAASDKAGAKGEVIYGTATPAADKRLAQNLWIDTTGGANTPKRWTGSAWVAVTDKAATDAAAAAASALAQVATKADASALQTLSNTVTSQGNTLTSQGNALTGLLASIGSLAGNGANLLDSAYSWLDSTTLPVTGGTLLTKVGVAVPEADSGFGYSLQASTDNIFSYIVMAPANNQASYNIRVEPGVYLVSMYVKGGTAGSMMANLYDGVTSRSVILPYTTERTRITFPITIPVSTKVGLLIYPNRHAAASASMVVDSIMVEKRVGESNVPSPFVAGPSARATGALAAANQALDVRVTQTESGLSSASSSITNLGNSLATTNQNVTAAQQAAQSASNLAGSKGKVIVQSAAPDVADRLSQNLWIDTTGNANTPKRWTGSAWVAVTDKAATDAAAAAANALAVAQTKADASALQALSTTVTNQGNTLSSQGNSITSLINGLQTTNGNVTTAQQAAQAASDLAGSKGKVLYQTATPAIADRQAENLWIDTTAAANTPKRWNGSAWVAVTDKVATDAAAAAQSALTQLASKADASALQTLQSAVTSQGGTINSQGTALTQLKASLSQQPDNLVLRGTFEDGLVDPWTGNPGIAGLTAHPSAGKAIAFYANSFCGTGRFIVSGGEQFDLSADVYRAYMTAGQTGNFQVQFFDKTDTNLGYFNAFTFSAGGGFQTFSGRITAPAAAVSARFVTRIQPADGTGRSLWCNIVARRVTAADAANGEAISTLGTTVTQQGTTLTSQGQSLLSLASRLTDAEGVNSAQATAISQMDTTVKQQGTVITAQASRLDGLYVQVNPEMEGDSTGLAGATGGLVGVWTEQSARIEDGIAIGRQVETVQAQMGQTNASVQQVSEVVAGINGRVSAQTTLKVETNQGNSKVISGIAIGSNGEEGEILLMAQRLAIIDSLNGQTILPFVVEGGQIYINQAVINKAFIQNIVAGMTIRSQAVNSQGLPLLELNFVTGAVNIRGQDADGSTLLNNGGFYVYDANGIERTALGRLG